MNSESIESTLGVAVMSLMIRSDSSNGMGR